MRVSPRERLVEIGVLFAVGLFVGELLVHHVMPLWAAALCMTLTGLAYAIYRWELWTRG